MLYDAVINFFILLFLEIVLGIDNLIFISMLANEAPRYMRLKVQILGLSIALLMRICLIFCITKILTLNHQIILLNFSIKDIILIIGGAFLFLKSIKGIYCEITCGGRKKVRQFSSKTFIYLVLQIIIIDLVFSIDSIIAAIGVTYNFSLIVFTLLITMIIMILLSNRITILVNKYSRFKTIAIVFVCLVGLLLLLEGVHIKCNRNFIYYSLIFSLIVESINIAKHKNS